MSADGGTKAIVAALGANLGIAVSKFVAFVFTGSSSMLAESIHSIADSGNQALLLLGKKRSQRGRTAEHPFGFGRERYFYAFIVALVLFTVGAVFSLYEGIHKIQHALAHPEEKLDSPAWAFGVLSMAIVLECFSFRTAIVESNRVRGEQTWTQFIRKSKSPELPVVLLEDLGALVGLILALAGVTLAVVTEDVVWDGIGTVCIGVLLALIAVVLAFETKSLLLGEGAGPEVEKGMIEALESVPEVDRVIHLRTQYIGPEELLVAAKIAVDHDDTAAEIAKGIDAAEAKIRGMLPVATLIYLEPDLYREPAPVAEPASAAAEDAAVKD
ncbi:cation diffusion facilitator family transporter [Actinocorallia aurantiaca]|uniref:Cation diffusion facilitator family transporter n=1 Tax=Actinocorallia aurantiaca TaxID=46204 RepID=A0ABP6GY60_9ACTN